MHHIEDLYWNAAGYRRADKTAALQLGWVIYNEERETIQTHIAELPELGIKAIYLPLLDYSRHGNFQLEHLPNAPFNIRYNFERINGWKNMWYGYKDQHTFIDFYKFLIQLHQRLQYSITI